MQSDSLQQLRDIHLPADPSWWPPAPGWWLLAGLALLALAFGARALQRAWHRRRPRRAARQLLTELDARRQRGELDDESYVHQLNELLKRLLVRGLGRTGVAALQGDAWLRQLDAEARSRDFTEGPGRVLGTARFAPAFEVDPDGLSRAVGRLCDRVRLRPPGGAPA